MIKLIIKYKWYIGIILVLMIVEPSINSILNFWLRELFNSAVPGVNKIYILRMLTVGFLYWMAKRLVGFLNGVLKARYICNAKQELKHQIFANLLHVDMANISDNASSGDYISLFTNDIFVIEQRFFSQIISLVSGIFSVLILGSSFIALNFKLAMAILFVGMIAMLVPVFFSKELNKRNLVYSNVMSKFTQSIKEYLVAYPTIKNYSIEQVIGQKFDEENNKVEDAKFDAEYVLILANSIGSLLSWFMQFVGVGMGLMLVIKGEILIGTVIAAQSFANDLATPLQEIIVNINSIRSVREIIVKLKRLSDSNVQQQLCYQCNDYKVDRCDIKFENLYLNIDGKTIIDHFSFDFESGKKYLIVGVNGSGKTSLFKALKKWFNNCSGSIYINKQNISTMSNEDIGRAVSYINEDVSLFSCSVRNNILLFRNCQSKSFDEAVNHTRLNIDLECEIIDEGRNISSGERRRIEIARSLIEAVPALIFDEVVSTLDIETAYEIEKLALGLDGKTIIFISHNFSGKLIREYDDILVMGKGKLLAHGTYDELIQSCEYFRKICEIKFG